MKNVFISFSSVETDEAMRICRMLEKNGIECFISARDLVAGEEYASQLLEKIDEVDVVLLLLSKASNESPHVLREVEYAVSHKTPIIVYSIEEVTLSKSMEYYLMTHQWITEDNAKDKQLVDSIGHIMANKNENANNQEEIKKVIAGKNVKSAKPKTGILLAIIIALLILILVIIVIFVIKPGKKGENNERARVSANNNETQSNPDNNQQNITDTDYVLGDYVSFGTFYGEPIIWRVLKINGDGTMLLVSQDILTMRAYDAAEGGYYNYYEGESYTGRQIADDDTCKLVKGNKEWATSNIRTWLNSDMEAVTYNDQKPNEPAVLGNAYGENKGFLYYFTQQEKTAIKPVMHANSEDFVFLLSSDELSLFSAAGMNVYAKPTAVCVENDDATSYYKGNYRDFGTDNFCYWLRDSSSQYADEANLVVTEYEYNLNGGKQFVPWSVGTFELGIRPAVCVYMNSPELKKVDKFEYENNTLLY